MRALKQNTAGYRGEGAHEHYGRATRGDGAGVELEARKRSIGAKKRRKTKRRADARQQTGATEGRAPGEDCGRRRVGALLLLERAKITGQARRAPSDGHGHDATTMARETVQRSADSAGRRSHDARRASDGGGQPGVPGRRRGRGARHRLGSAFGLAACPAPWDEKVLEKASHGLSSMNFSHRS